MCDIRLRPFITFVITKYEENYRLQTLAWQYLRLINPISIVFIDAIEKPLKYQ